MHLLLVTDPLVCAQGIDQLPVVPQLFELIGIAFSAWFVYRYLLFKPDRCVRAWRAQPVAAAAATNEARRTPHREELKRTLSELKTKVLS